MGSQYEYYKDLCNCPGIPASSAGDNEAAYDFLKNYCICDGEELFVGMRDLDGNEVAAYPVTAYDVTVTGIGGASTKSQYVTVWNSDPDNQAIGILKPGPGPFGFLMNVKPGQAPPAYVIGDPTGVIEGIYGIEYGTEYE